MNKKIITLIGLISVSGCSTNDIKEAVGLARQSPDEFMIVTNEPLVIPSDTKLVRPGTVKKVATNRISPSEQARLALVGGEDAKKAQAKAKTSAKLTSGEKDFLSNIETGDKDIATKLEQDNKDSVKNLFSKTVSVDVVDAEAEANRIKELKEKGETISGNDTKSLKTRIKASE